MASGSISALNERLRSSAGKGNWEEIEQLLRHGATFEADKYGRTALHYAAHYGQVKTLKVCISRGCELDKVDTYGCTALHKAIAPDGHVEAVRALIDEGCDVHGQDGNGNTCVHEGAMNGFSQSLDVLIKIGKANIHTSNKNGERAIHLACQHGHNQSTRILLKAGSHPDVKNSSGETPLHIACLYGHITCARILISADCDINMKNKDGNTPLHITAGLGKLKIAKLLLESQCEVKMRNKNNQTPLDVARQTDQRDAALLIIGAHRMKKGKLSFFSRNKKKDSSKLDGFGNSSHHHHSDSSPNDKHKRKHTDDRRGDDDMDGGQGGGQGGAQGGARIRGRREMDTVDRHSSGSSKGKSKKKREKKSQGQNLFVREEMKKHLKSEKKLQEQIHLGRELGNCQHTEQGNPHFRTQLFKDKTGKILHVPMPVHCNCTPYIKKLENQVEASKERLLHEIDISKARFESRMNNIEKRMTHQAQCMDQLCKERIAAEKGDCIHRIDKRAKEERKAWSEEHDARTDVLRRELRHWFESRIQPLHEQLNRTMDDAAIENASSTRRSRPRAGFYRLNGREVVTHRKRSKSVGNVSDCDLEEEDEEDSDEESEDESEDEEEEKEHVRKNSRFKERPVSSSQPCEQSAHHYKKTETAKAKDYAKSGAIPKSSRSGSFRLAVSDEDRASGSSSNSGTPLSMVDGTYRPPLITAHERSPNTDSHHSLPTDFVFPSQETEDTESSESSESETTSQQSLETVSYKPKSISGSTDVSSSTRDSGLHTLKGSSVSSDRRSHGPTRADLIAYQALTVNARPPPPLHAQVRPRHPVSTQPPPAELRMHANYTPPFSPPVSPTSTASQPLSSSTLASSDGHRVATPSTEQPSSDNPSPTDSGKAQSTSSGISSGEASSLQNSSPIKYNIISPHSGQSYQGTYNPRSSSSSHQPDLFKVIKSETMKTSHDEPPPPYRSKNGASSDNRYRVAQPYLKNLNNSNNDQSLNQSRSNEVPPKIGHAPTASNPYASSVRGGRMSSHTDQMRIGSGSDSSTSVKTQSMGYSAAPSRSAASRLGVTPTLGAVRGVYSNTNTTGKGLNQLHLQPRTQASQQSLPPGFSVVQGRSGSNGAVFAITRTNQSHAGNPNRPEIPVNKNNNAAPNSKSTSVHSGSITSSTSRTFNNHATSGNQYNNVPTGASTRNNGTFNAPNNNFYCSGGTKDSTSGTRATSSSHSNKTSGENYASNRMLTTDPRNHVRIGGAVNGADDSATNYTIDKRTRGTSNSISGVASMSTNRRSGAAFISNGASNGASLVTTVESFNRTAAPEQKLKYTREIIL